MNEPILQKAADLKKELETDTPREFQDAVKGPMAEILKLLLEAITPADDRKASAEKQT